MPQYKHSSKARPMLTDFRSERGKTTAQTLFAFMVLMLAVLICAGAVSSFNTINGTESVYNVMNRTYLLPSELAYSDARCTFIPDHWIFVPNITPNDVDYRRNYGIEKLYAAVPYADNVTISDGWRGWYDFNKTGSWHNKSKDISYKHFQVNADDVYCAAYINRFRCDPSVGRVYMSIHNLNGVAHIYCNGNFVGTIGNQLPVFNLNAFLDHVVLTPDNGNIDLIVVVSCNSKVNNPGILSYPVLENSESSDARIAITSGHFAVIMLLFVVAVFVGSNLILGTVKNKPLFVSFVVGVLSLMLYYTTDSGFISVNAHHRADIKFMLIILSTTGAYTINHCIFERIDFKHKTRLNQIDMVIVHAASTAIILTYLVLDYCFNMLTPIFFALIHGLAVESFALFKDIFLYRRRNPEQLLAGLSFSFMFFVLYISIMMEGTGIYMLPTYSILFILFVLAAESMIVYRIINQQHALEQSSANLKRQISEKTQYISEINKDLLSTNKKLLEGEQARKNVLSNVSHDLRTPITAIRGYTELLLTSGDKLSDSQRSGYLTNIIRRSEQMERIVSDIMELTRMEASDADFSYTDVSLSEMLDEVTMMYSMDLDGTGKHLALEIPEDDSLIIKADTRKISRVFENLISNAINYTSDQASITVKAWRTDSDKHISEQKVHVSVSDNGIGIPEEELPHIFDRFYRAKNSGINIKGTGLGLAIVKLICDKHNAVITVDSKIGVGTTFEIVFEATY